VARDRPERQIEERRRQLRVDPLVGLDLTVAEVEERLPADESPRAACPSPQVCGIRLASGRIL
jgi:hypothetical protein